MSKRPTAEQIQVATGMKTIAAMQDKMLERESLARQEQPQPQRKCFRCGKPATYIQPQLSLCGYCYATSPKMVEAFKPPPATGRHPHRRKRGRRWLIAALVVCAMVSAQAAYLLIPMVH